MHEALFSPAGYLGSRGIDSPDLLVCLRSLQIRVAEARGGRGVTPGFFKVVLPD